jgi:23S rRNA (cytidine2498-2'-O)-methyltransferase
VPYTSRFVFTLCQIGAEAALKRELSRLEPRWAAAYQRPGLVTFRLPDEAGPELARELVFARQLGLSLGSAPDATGLLALLAADAEPLCLHVVPRDPDDAEHVAYAERMEDALRGAQPRRFTEERAAAAGALVATVVTAPSEPALLGIHRQRAGRCPLPGGYYPIALPPEAPSRAYLKIEEAIATFDLPLRAGDTALEIGAAPGGAAYALWRRGVSVIAVDPGALDPALLAGAGPSGARVTHLPIAVADLRREQLPRRVDWLLLDVHLAPQIALRAARRLGSWLRPSLAGAVLTLKLNDWRFADRTPAFVQQASELGLVAPRAKQLRSHRQELAIVGLTQRGADRV